MYDCKYGKKQNLDFLKTCKISKKIKTLKEHRDLSNFKVFDMAGKKFFC